MTLPGADENGKEIEGTEIIHAINSQQEKIGKCNPGEGEVKNGNR